MGFVPTSEMGMDTDPSAVPVGVTPFVLYISIIRGASGGLKAYEIKFQTSTLVNEPLIPAVTVCASQLLDRTSGPLAGLVKLNWSSTGIALVTETGISAKTKTVKRSVRQNMKASLLKQRREEVLFGVGGCNSLKQPQFEPQSNCCLEPRLRDLPT
jgi:hypothetical protein